MFENGNMHLRVSSKGFVNCVQGWEEAKYVKNLVFNDYDEACGVNKCYFYEVLKLFISSLENEASHKPF